MASTRTPIRRVFVDSSVLLAAALSSTGAGWGLLQEALRENVEIFISPLVLQEVSRNLARKAPRGLGVFRAICDSLPLNLATPDEALISAAAAIVAPKDAPIVAAALAAHVEAIATYDRRHLLLRQAEIQASFGLLVALPDEILRGVRR